MIFTPAKLSLIHQTCALLPSQSHSEQNGGGAFYVLSP